MGNCTAKPQNQKKNNSKIQKLDRNAHKGLSFIQQVLNVNGVKSQDNDHLDAKMLKKFQQKCVLTPHSAQEMPKVLLANIQASSIIQRRLDVSSQIEQQHSSSPSCEIQNVQPQNPLPLSIQQQRNKPILSGCTMKQTCSSGNDYSIHLFQNQSTQNSLQPNFSILQLNPPLKNSNEIYQQQSTKSLENIK